MSSTLQKAIDIVTRATEEDSKRNYDVAFKMYQHGVEFFIHSINYEIQNEKAKESIRAKCIQYMERAEKLKKHLIAKKNEKPIKDTGSGEPRKNNGNSSNNDYEDPEEKKFLNQLKGMNSRILEVCVDNIESAVNAESGGADRIELCEALEVGGVTPSSGLVKVAKQKLTIPVFMLIRPRAGNFAYTELELKQMVEDIHNGLSLGVDGFVTGALSNGKVDMTSCQCLINAAHGLPVTFHRAFDVISDDQALDDVIELGFSRILTSGRAPTAFEGMETIKNLIEKAGSKIIIMPGSGISDQNLLRMLSYTKAHEYHSSAQLQQKKLDSEESVVKGTTFFPLASSGVVRAMKNILSFQ